MIEPDEHYARWLHVVDSYYGNLGKRSTWPVFPTVTYVTSVTSYARYSGLYE